MPDEIKKETATPVSRLKLSEELSLSKDFYLTSALRGNLVGYTDSDGKMHTGTLKESVTQEEFSEYGAVYAVKDGEKEVLFDRQGNCVSPEYSQSSNKPQLKNVTATLPTFDNNKVQTRSGEETATINAIRPIDQFAIAIIQPILERLQNPQEMSDADILKWSDVAYKWAQGMFSIASTFRTANDTEVSTNSDSVKTSIDNVVAGLNVLTTEIKNKETSKFPDVVKVDNPDNDKFKVDGEGGLSYDSLLDIGMDITSIPAFKDKAIGRTTLINLFNKLIALDTALSWLRSEDNSKSNIWNTNATAIYNAISSAVSSAASAAIDEKIKAFAQLNSLKTS